MAENSYINWLEYSDKSLTETIGRFVHHHRLRQNRSQDEISHDAGISRSTLSLLERGERVNLNTLIKVLRVLDLLYIMDVFVVSDEISPMEYAKLKMKSRKRASTIKNTEIVEEEDIGW